MLRFDSEINYAATTSAWTGLSFADHFAVSWTGLREAFCFLFNIKAWLGRCHAEGFIIITLPGLYTFQVGAGVRTMRVLWAEAKVSSSGDTSLPV